MNEVTKIHLGRQAFTIAVDAHKVLKAYLAEIKSQVSDKTDVIKEVEIRMAELLGERGLGGEKVVLMDDVLFLKEQLGDPAEFQENDETPASETAEARTKRLFRDTDHAILAGVAAGLAAYLGVDVMLVRLIFIIGLFTGGWGVLLYIILWLLVPVAKTPSERLQMAGQPVTVDSLKEVVERADVKGAAGRLNNSLSGPVNSAFRFLLKLIGISFMALGLVLLLSLASSMTYVWLRGGNLTQSNLFPVGLKEHLLLSIAAAVAALIALFVVLIGMAIFRRKWPIRGWITGVLIGLVCIGLAVGGALAADVTPQVRDRYQANTHTTVRIVQPFTSVTLLGDNAEVDFETAPTYAVSFHYYGHPDISAIKTSVSNGTLTVDSQQFDSHRDCNGFCIPDIDNVVVTVKSPSAPQANTPSKAMPLPSPEIP